MSDDGGQTVKILLDMTTTLSRVEGQNSLILAEQARLAAEQVRLAEGRREMYQKLDMLNLELVTISSQVAGHAPHIKEFVALRQNIKGGVVVAGVFGAALLALVIFGMQQGWQWVAAHLTFR